MSVPDAPGSPWRSLLSNHTPSAKPLPPAAPEAPVRLPPPPEAFRPRILSSQTRPVPSHDTPLPLNLSRTLPYSTLFLPYPADVFLPPSLSPTTLPILLVCRIFSVFAGRSRYWPDVLLLLLFSPSTLHTLLVRRMFVPSAECFYRPPNVFTVRRTLYHPPGVFPYPLSHCLSDRLVFIQPTHYYDFLANNRPPRSLYTTS